MKPIIYAAGPIVGQSYGEATDWRHHLQTLLPECDVRSPMRGKEFLAKRETMPDSVESDILSSQHAIVMRDHWDVHTCDILVINFASARAVSIGSCFELAWAFAYRTPAVVVMDKAGLHDHPFVREAAYALVTDLDVAADIVRQLLNLGVLGNG